VQVRRRAAVAGVDLDRLPDRQIGALASRTRNEPCSSDNPLKASSGCPARRAAVAVEHLEPPSVITFSGVGRLITVQRRLKARPNSGSFCW
jgi:hypothetical protein